MNLSPILHAFPARSGERGTLPHISRRFDARRLGPGEWPDPSGIRVVREHVPVGDHGRLVDRPAVRLLPGARGARSSRGHREDEGDRQGDPGGGEGLPLAPVPNARGLPRPTYRDPVLHPSGTEGRGALRILDQVRALARVHPGRGVQRDDRLRGDVARRPGERPDRERRPRVGSAARGTDRLPRRRGGRDVHGGTRPVRRDGDPADLQAGRHERAGGLRVRRRLARDVHAGGRRHLHEGGRRGRRPGRQGRTGDPRGRSAQRRDDRR